MRASGHLRRHGAQGAGAWTVSGRGRRPRCRRQTPSRRQRFAVARAALSLDSQLLAVVDVSDR